MRILFAILFSFIFCNLFSREVIRGVNLAETNCSGKSAVSFAGKKPNPLWFNFLKKQSSRKKIIASTLAFPFPFGILGIHRIYLGTKPYIPLIYVGTLGGCAGLLPLIDFINLVSNKDITRFENNPRIFIWVDNEAKK